MEPLDLIGCLAQLLVLAILTVRAAWLGTKRDNPWLFRLLAGAFACYFSGTLFWALHFFIIGLWPSGFSAADLAYVGCYCFLLSANLWLIGAWTDRQREAAREYRRAALIAPAVVIALHVVYVWQAGGLANNVLYCVPLAASAYYALWPLLAASGTRSPQSRRYYWAILLALLLELLIFLVSSFGLNTLYYALCAVQTAELLLILPAAKKAVAA